MVESNMAGQVCPRVNKSALWKELYQRYKLGNNLNAEMIISPVKARVELAIISARGVTHKIASNIFIRDILHLQGEIECSPSRGVIRAAHYSVG